jgi:hypothetical protein
VKRLPNGVAPTGAVLDHDGYCVMSDLPPEMCGLACHRGSPDVPVLDALFDDGGRQ